MRERCVGNDRLDFLDHAGDVANSAQQMVLISHFHRSCRRSSSNCRHSPAGKSHELAACCRARHSSDRKPD
jgi:hypothetical protein